MNSHKINLRLECEPFDPSQIPAPDCSQSQIDPKTVEEEKVKTVSRLYHYYSFLLLEQNRERLFSHPEKYKELAASSSTSE